MKGFTYDIGPSVRLTRKSIADTFNKCNELYFGNKLETPLDFETWTPSEKTLGMVRPVWSPKYKRAGSILHISRRYRWTEYTLRLVMVHEMIHLAIDDYLRPLTFLQRLPLIGKFFIIQHDAAFMALMNDINTRYGLHVDVRFPEMRQRFIR